MKLLIAGSRDVDYDEAMNLIDQAYWKLPGLAPDVLITGDAFGVDTIAQDWWLEYLGGPETIAHYPADWARYGRRAGYIRNALMVDQADLAIIVWDGRSNGTRHTLGLVKKKGIPYVLMRLVGDSDDE